MLSFGYHKLEHGTQRYEKATELYVKLYQHSTRQNNQIPGSVDQNLIHIVNLEKISIVTYDLEEQ